MVKLDPDTAAKARAFHLFGFAGPEITALAAPAISAVTILGERPHEERGRSAVDCTIRCNRPETGGATGHVGSCRGAGGSRDHQVHGARTRVATTKSKRRCSPRGLPTTQISCPTEPSGSDPSSAPITWTCRVSGRRPWCASVRCGAPRSCWRTVLSVSDVRGNDHGCWRRRGGNRGCCAPGASVDRGGPRDWQCTSRSRREPQSAGHD